jgi:small subunit ribosomal protein S4
MLADVMARRGPRLRLVRRLGTPLAGLTRKTAERRPYPPGVHGAERSRRKSDYRRRLEEKQKVRFHYGVSEAQLRRYFAGADDAFELLERRLDNVVFRLGFAPTIPAARQLVGHGHVHVNDRRVNRPGALLRIDDRVSVATRARRMRAVVDSVEQGPSVRVPDYLAREADDPFTGRMVGRPSREDVPFIVDPTAIVEFYAG